MKPLLAWLRRQFGWSTSRGSWYERLGAMVLLLSGVGGWWLSESLPIDGRLLLAALWLALLAVLVRHDIVRLVGDRKSTRLNSSHIQKSRMPSSA